MINNQFWIESGYLRPWQSSRRFLGIMDLQAAATILRTTHSPIYLNPVTTSQLQCYSYTLWWAVRPGGTLLSVITSSWLICKISIRVSWALDCVREPESKFLCFANKIIWKVISRGVLRCDWFVEPFFITQENGPLRLRTASWILCLSP